MAFNTVKIKKYSDVVEEFEANAAITPGMLVEVMSTGKLRAHATALGNAFPMFALEDELQGKGIDDDYAAGDQVQAWIPGRGDIVNALLRDEENVAIGDFVESDGEGRLRKYVAEAVLSADAQEANTILEHRIVGQVVAAVNLSSLPEGSESSAGGAYYNPRVQVRII
jgi:hypothetical protein